MTRLDLKLESALKFIQDKSSGYISTYPYQGLLISEDQSRDALKRLPGAPLFAVDDVPGQSRISDLLEPGTRLSQLQQIYQLTPFDMEVLLLALAPELDRRYEQIYACLQDHAGRRWPSIDLALNLFCANAVERIRRRVHFSSDAPLFKHGVMRLVPESDQAVSSLLEQSLKLDEFITHFLLCQDELDRRLASFCTLFAGAEALDHGAGGEGLVRALSALMRAARLAGEPLRLYLRGADGAANAACARAVAAAIDVPLLAVNLHEVVAPGGDASDRMALVWRYAYLYDVVLFLDGVDVVREAQPAGDFDRWLNPLADYPGSVVLSGQQPWPPATRRALGVLTLTVDKPGFAERRAGWQGQLAAYTHALSDADLDGLADRFQLTQTQIAEASMVAHRVSKLRASREGEAEPRLV
ncbi:MAG: hypothetical protein ETSY1_27515 [Candidatus Entotheonella factor]|uniref:Winged helix domain-containing protein n=1 Tax=Entotheonella factor TaxID=1429438 RepID=W4LE60_ENTF1|nr:MAG: hypothetical protein ETSY1_27515 [Candidatus Entotheonella factor]